MDTRNDFPGVKNTATGIESTWIFHGVACSQAQAALWRNHVDQGHCPWCKKAVSHRYNNANKHLRACTQKPEVMPSALMSPKKFAAALSHHPKMQPNGAATRAARMVLVDGMTAYAAAITVRINQSAVSRAVSRLVRPHCPSCRCFHD